VSVMSRKIKAIVEKLSIVERLHLESLVPRSGNYIDLLTIQELRKELMLSDDEVVQFEIKQVPQGVAWNRIKESAAGPKEIRLKQNAQKVLKEALMNANKEGKLPDTLIGLFERHVPEKDRILEETK